MPKQLNNGQVTQALQRAFGFKGRYTPMLDEVIVPVYNIQDPSPATVTLLCAGIVATPVGLGTSNFKFCQLFNPSGSGRMINITHAHVTGTIKFNLNIRYHDVPGNEQRPESAFRDRRNRGKPVGQVIRDDQQTALVGSKIASLQIDGALSQSSSWQTSGADPRQPLTVLEPGQGVIVQDSVATPDDDSFEVSWRWLEIPLTETNPLGGIPG